MYYYLFLSLASFFLLFLLLEGRRILENPWRAEYGYALLLFLLSFAYAADLAQDWHLLPNPAALFAKLKPLSDLLENI